MKNITNTQTKITCKNEDRLHMWLKISALSSRGRNVCIFISAKPIHFSLKSWAVKWQFLSVILSLKYNVHNLKTGSLKINFLNAPSTLQMYAWSISSADKHSPIWNCSDSSLLSTFLRPWLEGFVFERRIYALTAGIHCETVHLWLYLWEFTG